jgi:hypothetical protein
MIDEKEMLQIAVTVSFLKYLPWKSDAFLTMLLIHFSQAEHRIHLYNADVPLVALVAPS